MKYCIFEITMNGIIDPKGPDNIICTIMKYGEAFRPPHMLSTPASGKIRNRLKYRNSITLGLRSGDGGDMVGGGEVGLKCHVLSSIVPWNCGAFYSMP